MTLSLLIDAGNTRLKWGFARHGELLSTMGCEYRGRDLGALLQAAWAAQEPPSRVLLASVANAELDRRLRLWVQEAWGLTLERVVAAERAFGVTNAYPAPATLGADRWAALIAVRQLVPGAVCVIDCGTATTFDALSAEGRHLGGLIIPGMGLMKSSLIENTAVIDAAAGGADTEGFLACDTRSAVDKGCRVATVGFVERLIAEVAARLAPPVFVIVSGGAAPALLPLLRGEYRHEPNLVLKGLNVIAQGEA